MRFFEVVLSGAALISAALAVEFNSWPESVKAGQTVTLTYSPKDAATTIILRKGPSTNLDTLETLTSSSTGGSFEWTVPSTLANGADYAFEIRQAGAEPNYSGQFSLSGGSAASSAAASSSAGYSTAESSSAVSSTAYSTAVSTTVKTSVITSAASASASIVPSHGANSTISTGTPSATTSESSASSTSGSPPVENTGAASSFGTNPVALFMGAAAALAYLA
ncbi:hypothetical protein N0V90_006237 [Kalmusia sp. IMI 367209]|nr:hypothetical protein N0V90_006237 [Kalmusia sp. IMI 367209]